MRPTEFDMRGRAQKLCRTSKSRISNEKTSASKSKASSKQQRLHDTVFSNKATVYNAGKQVHFESGKKAKTPGNYSWQVSALQAEVRTAAFDRK